MFGKALVILSLLGLVSCNGFGPYFSLGPTSSWIREATTTLVLPATPRPQQDIVALWPGMGTSNGDLIQAIAGSFANPAAHCGGHAGEWCTWASTLEAGTQLGGKVVPAKAGDKLTFHYKYNDHTGKYDQTVAVNGRVLSTLSTKSGHAEGWGTAVECLANACHNAAVAAHEYLLTTIILNSADKSFGKTLALHEATASPLTTSDGGKTWHVTNIRINPHTFKL